MQIVLLFTTNTFSINLSNPVETNSQFSWIVFIGNNLWATKNVDCAFITGYVLNLKSPLVPGNPIAVENMAKSESVTNAELIVTEEVNTSKDSFQFIGKS